MSVLTRVLLVTAPATLTAQVIGPTRIDLSWPVVLGAASYRVYRGGVLVDSPIGLTSSSTGLTPSTLYSFRVASVGADGQEGPQGPQTSANTTAAADTTAPTAPVLGTPTQSGSNSLIVPMTTASTDASGIASYSLERATAAIGPFTVINTVALFPYTDLGLSAATAYWYRARATDNATNVGAYSNIVTQTTIAQSSVIRFNPGHGMTIDTGSGSGGMNAPGTGWLAQIDSIASEPNIKFVKFAFDWDDIEHTQNIYDWSVPSAIVSRCALYGKKVKLICRFQYFSGSVLNPAGRIPPYVISGAGYTAWDGANPSSPPGNLALVVNLWNPTWMARWNLLGQAAAAQYNTNPAVEMWMIGETSVANLPGSGYTDSSWLSALQNWATVQRAAWTQTGLRIYTNYLDTSSDTRMQALFATMEAQKITGGGPDNYSRIYQSNPVYTGFSGGIDRRNVIPWDSENQAPASSSGGASVTAAQIYDHNENGLLSAGGSTKPNYYTWPRGILGGQSWASILAYINSIGGACNTTNPYLAFDYYISPVGSNSNSGSQSSPWAISALNDPTKRALYAGRRVGLLDGVYNISAMPTLGGGDVNLLAVIGGATPTLIASVSPLGATIQGNGDSYPHVNCGLIGCTTDAGNVIFDGLRIVGAGSIGMVLGNSGNQVTATRTPGIVVRNCEISGTSGLGAALGGNYGCIKMYATSGVLISNNYFHDNFGPAGPQSPDHWDAIMGFYVDDAVIENNTLVNTGGIFGKASPCRAPQIRYNYINMSGWLANSMAIQNWTGGTLVTTGTPRFYGNVIVAPMIDFRDGQGAGGWFATNVEFFNNTIVLTATSPGTQHLMIRAAAGMLKFYNNIIVSAGTGDNSFITVNVGAPSVFDRNLYHNSAASAKWATFPAANSNTRNSYPTHAEFRAAMGGGLIDLNSIIGSDPLFASTGIRADFYQLDQFSPAKDRGKSDGTSSGTTCDMGAWGGASPPSRIGCNF